ncbi:PHP domain-containing protein [Deinococcus taklimakanensis]|uniref:PHP domain-containing protein n=1 Tax=Deinococcus taklimakanensis TaxID=536443 RepID=A0ABW5P202_9DEIO
MPRLDALLACQSFFSQGRSAVSPKRLVQLAAERGYTAVGLADWCSVAGAVELCDHAKAAGVRAVVGTTLPIVFPATGRTPEMTFPVVLLAKSREGYATLCELITVVNLQHPAGLPLRLLKEVGGQNQDHLVCLTGGRAGCPTVLGERREIAQAAALLRTLRSIFPFALYVQQ